MVCIGVMKIEKLSLSDNNFLYGSPANEIYQKGLAVKKECDHKQEDLTKHRPAEPTSLSGSERLAQTESFKAHYANNSVNFKGNPKLITNAVLESLDTVAQSTLKAHPEKDIPKWTQKWSNHPYFKKLLNAVNENEAKFEAVMALGFAGVLKPLCVLAMPGAEMEDKEMAATKNTVSAMIGFCLSCIILNPCSNAVNKILKSFKSKNPTKYIKDPEYVKALLSEEIDVAKKHQSTLADSFKSTFKKMGDIGVSPLKAATTIALTPVVMKAIFGDKKKKNKNKTSDVRRFGVMNSIKMDNINKSKGINGSKLQNNTPSFKGSPKQKSEDSKNDVSFKGLGSLRQKYNDALSEKIANAMGSLATTQPFRSLVDTFARFDKPTARWSDLASVAITFFYINNTRKSEKIDEERKLPLMINNGMITIASSGVAFAIDKYTDKPMENLLKGYIRSNSGELAEKSKNSLIKSLENANESIEKAAGIHGNETTELRNVFTNLAAGKQEEIKDLQNSTRDRILYHAEDYTELLKDGRKNLAPEMQKVIGELENNSIVKRAISNGLIKAEEVEKMALAGFENKASGIYKNIAKAKSLFIFVFTVRFLVTVLMTPVVGQVVEQVNKRKGKLKPEEIRKQNEEASKTIGMKDYLSSLNK